MHKVLPLVVLAVSVVTLTVGRDDALARGWDALESGESIRAERTFRLLLDEIDDGTDDADLVRILNGLATALVIRGEAGESRALFERALRLQRREAQPDSGNFAWSLHGLARSRILARECDRAEALLREELILREATAEEQPLLLARTLRELVPIFEKRAEWAAATSLAKRESALYERAFELGMLTVPVELEQVARDSEGWDPALRLHAWRAAAVAAESVWSHERVVADAYRAIARIYREHDAHEDALHWFQVGWDTRPPASFVRGFEAYRVFPNRKALALALDADGHWTYGFFTGEESESDAIDRAVEQCRRWLTRYSVDADCELYAVDDVVAWEPGVRMD